MSSDNTDSFTDAVMVTHLIEQAIHTQNVENDPSFLQDTANKSALATDPLPARPVSPARVGPSRNAHSRAFNDPSDYLG
jgi:hypothetical protein